MSQNRDIRRRLERATEAIEDLDAELAAGRIGIEEHGRRLADLERETGRLFVSLRKSQRETGGQGVGQQTPQEPAALRPSWLRTPQAIGAAAVLLIVVGVGAGVGVGRWSSGAREAAEPASAPSPVPAGDPSALLTDMDLRALRQIAARDDAPTPGLLQLAHAALDKGQLDEARQIYERVLAREPRNVEAITHMGSVLYQEGRVDEALAKVEAALRIDPRYIHAHWDRTQYLFYGKRDFPGAVKAAQAFLVVVPEGPDAESVRKLMAEAQQKGPTFVPVIPKSQ